MGKKPIASVTYENERISIKNSLPLIKCVSHLSCVVHGPIYGRFTTENHLHGHGPHRRDQTFQKSFVGFKQGLLRSPRGRLVASLRREVTHILCKVSCCLLKSFHFRMQVTEMIGFFPIQILIFRMLRNNADVRRCSYFELGLPVFRLDSMQAACYGCVSAVYL